MIAKGLGGSMVLQDLPIDIVLVNVIGVAVVVELVPLGAVHRLVVAIDQVDDRPLGQRPCQRPAGASRHAVIHCGIGHMGGGQCRRGGFRCGIGVGNRADGTTCGGAAGDLGVGVPEVAVYTAADAADLSGITVLPEVVSAGVGVLRGPLGVPVGVAAEGGDVEIVREPAGAAIDAAGVARRLGGVAEGGGVLGAGGFGGLFVVGGDPLARLVVEHDRQGDLALVGLEQIHHIVGFLLRLGGGGGAGVVVHAHLQSGGSGGLYVGLELGVGVQVEGLQRGIAAPDEHEGDAVCLHLFPVDGALPLGYINAVVDILGLGMGVFVGLLGVGVGTGGEGGDAIVLSVRLMPGVFPPILGVINGGVEGLQCLLYLGICDGSIARCWCLFWQIICSGCGRVLSSQSGIC